MKKYKYPLLLLIITCFLFYCQTNKPVSSQSERAQQTDTEAPQTAKVDLNASPVISATEAIKKMQVEDGFAVQLVAAEPLVNSPVALSFDARGRMWVVEMQGYMPDTVGTGEDIPNGKIVILEDKSKDGVAD